MSMTIPLDFSGVLPPMPAIVMFEWCRAIEACLTRCSATSETSEPESTRSRVLIVLIGDMTFARAVASRIVWRAD